MTQGTKYFNTLILRTTKIDGIFKLQKIYFKVAVEDLKLLKIFCEHFNNVEMTGRCLFMLENAFDHYDTQRICK